MIHLGQHLTNSVKIKSRVPLDMLANVTGWRIWHGIARYYLQMFTLRATISIHISGCMQGKMLVEQHQDSFMIFTYVYCHQEGPGLVIHAAQYIPVYRVSYKS